MASTANVSQTDRNRVIRLSALPIEGEFILKSDRAEHGILHDSRIHGGDIAPLLYIAPVVKIEAEDNVLLITVSEELRLNEE